MGRKGKQKKERSKAAGRIINVEIAPGNQRRLESWLAEYNARPGRRTPRMKYTDVVNAALDRFLEAHLPEVTPSVRGRKRG